MTICLPDEDRVRNEIQRELGECFGFAKRLLTYWLRADLDTGLNGSSIPPIVLRVALSMSIKATRQFRSVIELCERGEAADGAVIARAMFETALVVGFVLKHRFVPREFNRKGKVTKTINVPGVSLTREFRAMLFVAHQLFQPERFATLHADRPGLKRHAKRRGKIAANDSTIQRYRDEIGPEWTRILMRRPWTYSGLSIANLARSLGALFPQWYDLVYGSQSEHVHAADMLQYVQIDEEATTTPQWHEPLENVRGTLLTAIVIFYASIATLSHHVEFGVGMNTALYGFKQEYRKLIKAE